MGRGERQVPGGHRAPRRAGRGRCEVERSARRAALLPTQPGAVLPQAWRLGRPAEGAVLGAPQLATPAPGADTADLSAHSPASALSGLFPHQAGRARPRRAPERWRCSPRVPRRCTGAAWRAQSCCSSARRRPTCCRRASSSRARATSASSSTGPRRRTQRPRPPTRRLSAGSSALRLNRGK